MLRNKVAHESIRSPLQCILNLNLKKRSNLKRIRRYIYVEASKYLLEAYLLVLDI